MTDPFSKDALMALSFEQIWNLQRLLDKVEKAKRQNLNLEKYASELSIDWLEKRLRENIAGAQRQYEGAYQSCLVVCRFHKADPAVCEVSLDKPDSAKDEMPPYTLNLYHMRFGQQIKICGVSTPIFGDTPEIDWQAAAVNPHFQDACAELSKRLGLPVSVCEYSDDDVTTVGFALTVPLEMLKNAPV
jgi:hypothetical protein